MAKVKSDRDLVDSGVRALVDALGYSGAARFLRHFSKGEGDYLVIQKKLFKGMDLQEIYSRAEEHDHSGKVWNRLFLSASDFFVILTF